MPLARLALHGALLLAGGCALPIKITDANLDIARDATPVGIEAGIKAMDDPENKRRIANLLASEEMKAVERELARGMVDGTLAALGEEERMAKMGALSAQYAGALLTGFSRDVLPEIGPLMSAATRTAVQGAMRAAMSPELQGELSSAFSTAIRRDVGPAMEQIIRDDLGPGIAAALQNEAVKKALGETARHLGREIVLGVNEGMVEIQNRRPQGEASTLESLGALADKTSSIASGVTWVLGAVVLVLGGLLAKLLMQARKYRSESEQRDAATRLMLEARRASHGKPWSEELLAALEEQLRSQPPPPPKSRR